MRTISALAVVVGLLLLGWPPAVRANLCELRLGGVDTISVGDLSTGAAPRPVPVESDPGSLVLSPDYRHVYVSSALGVPEPQISVIDVGTWRTVDRIPLPFRPRALAIGADGLLYVAGGQIDAGLEDTPRVLIIDPTSKRIAAIVVLPAGTKYPRTMAAGGGGLLYVETLTDANGVAVHIIDVTRAEVVASHPLSISWLSVIQLVASPVDEFAYLTLRGMVNCDSCPPQVLVLRPDGAPTVLDVAAVSAAFSPDGTYAYLWLGARPNAEAPITVVDTGHQVIIDTLPGGRIVAVAEGGCVIIANGRSLRRTCPGDTESVPVPADEVSPQSVVPVVGNGVTAVAWTDGACEAPPLPCSADAACLEIVGASGTPGDSVEFSVRLHGHDHAVAGVRNDLFLDRALPLAAGPADDIGLLAVDCRVNPAINKRQSAIRCIESDDLGCITTRAVVISFDNLDPIPDGSLVYTCTLPIPADTKSGTYRVACVDPGASDPNGKAVITRCTDGEIVIAKHSGDTAIHGPAPAMGNGCQVGSAAPSGWTLSVAFAALLALARHWRRFVRAAARL